MAKKKQPTRPVKKDDDKVLLKERLNGDLFQQLKEKQKMLLAEEQTKKEEELARKKEEARLREKNKSFEELLNESSLDWSKYK
ncbi:YqkE family protein [Bacillus pinisoli]|uniref:YqkE family protein n=1 Tax=Bacillus pinisoli TaxID=2901866 RepID=UPI001FF5945C|nr:YqkE family protein [Bacillus pinisoli]